MTTGLICKYKWNAPRLRAPGDTQSRIYIEQKCSLLEGHEGEHRSLGNVTAENVKK